LTAIWRAWSRSCSAPCAPAAIGEAFQTVVEDQIGRRQLEADGPRLPLPPVGLKRNG
jgi:hypothetical protein